MYQDGPERKVILGTTPAMYWCAPMAMSGAPSLSYTLAAGVITPDPNLARVRASDTVDGLTGLETLTKAAENIPAAGGMTGPRWGRAVLITARDGAYPIQVAQIGPGAIVLASKLPHRVHISAEEPATVEYLWWKVATPADVTATLTKSTPIPWSVRLTEAYGGPDLDARQVDGVLHVVDRIFSPQVTPANVERLVPPRLLGRTPHNQSSVQPQIDAALGELVLMIRTRIDVTGRREDELDGTAFAPALARWAASIVMEAEAPEAAARQRAFAEQLVDAALASVSWFRPEGSTVGTTAQKTQDVSTIVGGSFGERPECPF